MTPLEEKWTIDEPASSERELRDFLYALVRLVKPKLIVETGCYLGRATHVLGEAALLNGEGRVVSCDTDEDICCHVRKRVAALPVSIRHCRGADLPELREADLVFLDSDYGWRRAEFDLVHPGALAVIHDTRISYDSAVPPHETWVRELGGLLFETHRGFALLRKSGGADGR